MRGSIQESGLCFQKPLFTIFTLRTFRQTQEIIRLFPVRHRFEIFIAVSARGNDYSDFFTFFVNNIIRISAIFDALNGICFGMFPLLTARVTADVFDTLVRVISVGFIDALHLQFCRHTFCFSFEASSTSSHFFYLGARGITPFSAQIISQGVGQIRSNHFRKKAASVSEGRFVFLFARRGSRFRWRGRRCGWFVPAVVSAAEVNDVASVVVVAHKLGIGGGELADEFVQFLGQREVGGIEFSGQSAGGRFAGNTRCRLFAEARVEGGEAVCNAVNVAAVTP